MIFKFSTRFSTPVENMWIFAEFFTLYPFFKAFLS